MRVGASGEVAKFEPVPAAALRARGTVAKDEVEATASILLPESASCSAKALAKESLQNTRSRADQNAENGPQMSHRAAVSHGKR